MIKKKNQSKIKSQRINKIINYFHNFVEIFFCITYNRLDKIKKRGPIMEINEIKRELLNNREKLNDLWRSL